MARLLLVVFIAVPCLGVGAAVGAWWAQRTARPSTVSDRELAFRERMAVLEHHTELLARARQAALDGQDGLANIYGEAADRVLRLSGDERPSS